MTLYGVEITAHFISVPSTTVLKALDVTPYLDGTLAYVVATNEYYSRQSFVTPDGVTNLPTSNGSGSWVPCFSGRGT